MAALGGGYSWFDLQRSLPRLEGKTQVSGLLSSVTIHTSRLGIPSIIAESRLDAMRALGYVTARDRLFQMDLLRRMSSGHLSEIFGEKALETDIRQRVLGFHRIAKEIIGELPQVQLDRAIVKS